MKEINSKIRQISPKDPWMNSPTHFKPYKPIHSHIQTTEDMLDKVGPSKSRALLARDELKKMTSMEARFYDRKKQQRETLGEKLRAMVEANTLSKHERVRQHPSEGPKLASIEQQLNQSQELLSIDALTEEFEQQTDREFNTSMNNEDRQARRKARIAAEVAAHRADRPGREQIAKAYH